MIIEMKQHCILLAVLGLVTVSRGQQVSCSKQVSSCACETAQGIINLQPLDSKDATRPAFDNILDYMQDSYSWNPCSSYTANGCSNVAACQNRYGDGYPLGTQDSAVFGNDQYTQDLQLTYTATDSIGTTSCQSRDGTGYPLGTQDTATFGNDPYTSDLTLTYSATGSDAVQRTVIVTLKCDQGQDGSLTAEGEYPTGTYDLTLTSKYACPGVGPAPGGSGGGLSGGSILLIVFFSLLFVYLLAGVLFNKYQKGASGAEMIPQVEFWATLPGLAKDGFIFTISKVKACLGMGTSQSGYDEF